MRIVQFFILLFSIITVAQNTSGLGYTAKLASYISSEDELPFWFTANDYGAVPNQNNGLAYFSFYSKNANKASKLTFNYKVAATGFLTESKNDVLINELYGSFHYKNWSLIIGTQNDYVKLQGLSSSNGDIVKSINARAFPGIKLQTNGYITLPFAQSWLSVSGYYADYLLNDTRVVDNAKLHSKRLYFKSKLSEKLYLITGLTHYAQWGGNSAEFGEQPQTFKDYLRVISGSSGNAKATVGDQINALGNQLGSYRIQFNYKGFQTHWQFYYSHLFDDRSGREMQNWRDGLYGLFIDLKKPGALISHILTEFTHTKHMSGDNPPDDADGGRGMDNYFNNSIYNSGWTYFGNVIGSPFFPPKPVDDDGFTRGVIGGDNRFVAFNLGVKGNIRQLPYFLKLSHVTYEGWFNNEYNPKPKQFSGIFSIQKKDILTQGMHLQVGAGFDSGSYTNSKFGGFIMLTKKGIF